MQMLQVHDAPVAIFFTLFLISLYFIVVYKIWNFIL